MFDSIVAAWKETMAVTNKVLGRIWGDQTSQESSLMKRAEHAEQELRAAKVRLEEANSRGDTAAKVAELLAVNSWRSELNRLRDEASAKRS